MGGDNTDTIIMGLEQNRFIHYGGLDNTDLYIMDVEQNRFILYLGGDNTDLFFIWVETTQKNERRFLTGPCFPYQWWAHTWCETL